MTSTQTEPKVIHATCVVERSFSKPPATVFAALSQPEMVREWFGGRSESHETIEFALKFAVGGTQRLAYRFKPGHPLAGKVLLNDGVFQDIVPNERIVTASAMAIEDKRISTSLVTFELLPTEQGTDLICTHQGAFFEGAGPDPAKMREQGWNTLMDRLVAVVEGRS